MRTGSIRHRSQFYRGALLGIVLVIVKLVFFLPVDIADLLYGVALLVTLIITIGELLESRRFTLEVRVLDFIVGLLFPLDCYAVLLLFGLPLTN